MSRIFASTILVIALVLATWLVATSPNFKYCAESQGQYPSETHDKGPSIALIPANEPMRIQLACIGGYLNENGMAVTGLATILLALITGFLVALGRSQGTTTRKQLRAYVGVDEMEKLEERVVDYDPVTKICKVNALMVNFGKTPAYDVHPIFRLMYSNATFLDKEFPKVTYTKGGILQPGQKSVLACKVENVDMPMWETIRHRRNRDWRLYFFGYVSYRDTFGCKHRTRFCFTVDRWESDSEIPGWDNHSKYNDTDDQQDSYVARLMVTAISAYRWYVYCPFIWGAKLGALRYRA